MQAATALSEVVDRVVQEVLQCLRAGGKVMWCGNGGSASDAQHLAAELVGRFIVERRPLSSLSLGTDTSVLTAIGNDYGFDEVFARQLMALGRPGDVLIAISTSGESRNVLRALEVARTLQIRTVVLTGQRDCTAWRLADHRLAAPSDQTAHVQEVHIALGQVICGCIEAELFS